MAQKVFVTSVDVLLPNNVVITGRTDDGDYLVAPEHGGNVTLVTKANFTEYYSEQSATQQPSESDSVL